MRDGAESGSEAEECEHEDSEHEVDLDEVVEALNKKRLEEELEVPAEAPFHMKVMGGPWCMANHGVPYDTFRATWRTADARGFLHSYGFNQSASFALAKFGEPLARCLAQYWVLKLSYLFALWDANGRGKYAFSEADVGGFGEPGDFTHAFEAADASQRARMLELRGLRPAALP